MIQRIRKWTKRYGGAELMGTTFAVLASSLTAPFTDHFYWIGLAGAWGKNIGFYGWIWRSDRQKNPGSLLQRLKNLLLEFGPSELLDTWLTRPFLMGFFGAHSGGHPAALLAGKFFADILFYFICILMTECRIKKPL